MINLFLLSLSEFRTQIIKSSFAFLELREAAILNGLLLGAAISGTGFKKEIRNAGLLHLVVASGSNISQLSRLVQGILIWAPYWIDLICQLLIIMLYALLVGIEPPIFRAACMSTYQCVSRLLGRQNNIYMNLLISYILSVTIFPAWISSLSLQLTYSATLAIVLIAKPLMQFIRTHILSRQPFLWITEELVVSLSATLGVSPILWLHIHQFSAISVITTPLVNWIVPYCMVIGLVFYATTLYLNGLSQLVANILHLPLQYILWIISMFGSQ